MFWTFDSGGASGRKNGLVEAKAEGGTPLLQKRAST